ncbi:MAG: hypothetical protein ABJC63_01770 [Gemmatimonadales bacterium]
MKLARAFLNGIIDYAGLFPPACHPMDVAVREFARYANGSDRDLLGRFILPVSQLSDFTAASRTFVNDQRHRWRLSAIVLAGKDADIEEIATFNRAFDGVVPGIVIDAVEMPVTSATEIEWAVRSFADDFEIFLEPIDLDDSLSMLAVIAKSGAKAKLRTGGIVASAIPSATSVIRFIDKCADLSLPFKATAGLHHALRGDYPLTYGPDAPKGAMFGYLNIFLAAAFHHAGLPESALFDLLEEHDSSSITFDESGAWWRGNLADESHLLAARKSLAVSFGSCSFTEPVDEARSMNLI